MSSVPPPIEPEALKIIRKKNWNIVHVVNGKAIMSASGINSAGGKNESMQRYDRAVFILKNLESCLKANYPFTEKSANKVLYVLPCGWNSGVIVFDNNISNDGFVIICKISKDDTSFIEDNFKIVRNLFPNLLKSTASKIKKKLSVNDSLLVYIPFNNPNMPCFKQSYYTFAESKF